MSLKDVLSPVLMRNMRVKDLIERLQGYPEDGCGYDYIKAKIEMLKQSLQEMFIFPSELREELEYTARKLENHKELIEELMKFPDPHSAEEKKK